MTNSEKYKFDTIGCIILKSIISKELIDVINEKIDQEIHEIESISMSIAGDSKILKSTERQKRLNNLLFRKSEFSNAFLSFLRHDHIDKYLVSILGKQYRFDHGGFLLTNNKHTEGHQLHGGKMNVNDLTEFYSSNKGEVRSGLLVVEFVLNDQPANKGGFCYIPGSHKSDFECPIEIRNMEEHTDMIMQPGVEAGDVIIFTEALCHGAKRWTNDYLRKTLIFKYSPRYMAYAPFSTIEKHRALINTWDEKYQQLMQPPFTRYNSLNFS